MMILRNPNFVVREFQSRGLPHKLIGLGIDAITEQCPDPESRITLSQKTDALGVPLARVDWRIDNDARRSLVRLGHLLVEQFPRAGYLRHCWRNGLPKTAPQDGIIIDMAHTADTTRMSGNPKLGIVNSNCKVHGVAGLYIASVRAVTT